MLGSVVCDVGMFMRGALFRVALQSMGIIRCLWS